MRLSKYPTVEQSEVRRLYHYLGYTLEASLDDLAGCVNEPVIFENTVADNTVMFYCLMLVWSWSEDWPAGRDQVPVSSHPDWVQEVYNRATASEDWESDIMNGAPLWAA